MPCPVATPTKRSRRLAKTVSYNDENPDPASSPFDDDEENDILAELPARNRKSPSQASTKQNPVTPSTPRHRDALSVPPTTPRHAVMSAGKLFKRLTPQTPLSPSTIQTIYHSARQLFARGAEPGQLVGREE